MPTLIALLSSGKGSWAEVNRIMQAQSWTQIFLVTNQFGQENFTSKPNNAQFVLMDPFQETNQMVELIKKQLEGKISDFEVALNLASGTGKEHMALLEAVLELGLNFRIVTLSQNGQMDVLGLKR